MSDPKTTPAGSFDPIDYFAIDHLLTMAAEHYERTAPTVCDWANDLYDRIRTKADAVPLSEINFLASLPGVDGWEGPNVAANRLYHLMHRLGRDTTGHAGF